MIKILPPTPTPGLSKLTGIFFESFIVLVSAIFIYIQHYNVQCHRKLDSHEQSGGCQEDQELPVVFFTNAIIKPLAVVVEFCYAFVTVGTV